MRSTIIKNSTFVIILTLVAAFGVSGCSKADQEQPSETLTIDEPPAQVIPTLEPETITAQTTPSPEPEPAPVVEVPTPTPEPEPAPQPECITNATIPTIGFGSVSSTASEAKMLVLIPVVLSAPSLATVSVAFSIAGGVASAVADGSGQDYVMVPGSLTFAPCQTQQNITVQLLDDPLNEADETVEINLSNPVNALLGEKNLHTFTIIDNDRKSLANVVTDFGAKADGVTDDTAAIQSAVDAVFNNGGGVIIFPSGVYLVTSVKIKENITYQGYGAVIKRPPMQGKWTRTFTTDAPYTYSGAADSKPLVIKGLTFDGSSQTQGPYHSYELEHAHLLFLNADPAYPGRLQAIIEDCKFQNGVADAISIYTNVAVKVYNSEATNFFRGGFVISGGYSS